MVVRGLGPVRDPADEFDGSWERRQLVGLDDDVALPGPAGKAGQRLLELGVREHGHGSIVPGTTPQLPMTRSLRSPPPIYAIRALRSLVSTGRSLRFPRPQISPSKRSARS